MLARWNPSEGGDRWGLETRVASTIFCSWEKVAHLAINLHRRTTISNRRKLRTAREMLLKLFQTLVFLKHEESFDTKSIREQNLRITYIWIPQKEVLIFNFINRVPQMEFGIPQKQLRYSGTLLIWSPMGQKNFSRINEGFFFYKKMYGSFCQAAKRSGRNNEVTVRRCFTVHCIYL